jgi:hypothetical protein
MPNLLSTLCMSMALLGATAVFASPAEAVMFCAGTNLVCIWVLQPPNACAVDVRSTTGTFLGTIDLCVTKDNPTNNCPVRFVYEEVKWAYVCAREHPPQFGTGTCTLIYISTDASTTNVIDICQ